mgnify:CR=1 FL=1
MWHVELAEQLPTRLAELSNIAPQDRIAPGVVIEDLACIDEAAGPVVIGPRTRICRGAVIKGPAYIGADCLIGNNSIVRGGCWISDNVKIGYTTEIKHAIIERDVSIGPLCFVADSIVRPNVYLGAMVRTSNHRADKQDVHVYYLSDDACGYRKVNSRTDKLGCEIGANTFLGVGCIILPGRIVPPDSQFGPGIHITKNFTPGTYSLKQEVSELLRL